MLWKCFQLWAISHIFWIFLRDVFESIGYKQNNLTILTSCLKYFIFVISFWFFGCEKLFAQPFGIRNLSLQEGLPEYYVTSLIQDRAGFIWVSTRDGLARYDGRQFKVFRQNPFAENTLADNIILSLQSIADTTILIHFENGSFQLFNPVTEKFSSLNIHKQLEQSPRTIVTDHENQIWGRLPQHIISFNRKTKQFKSYQFPKSTQSYNYYSSKSILIDKEGHFLAVNPGCLIEFDPKTEQFRNWKYDKLGRNALIETYYDSNILQRANGEIVISSVSQLILFDSQKQLFRSLPIPGVEAQAGLIYEASDKNVYFTHGMTVYRLTIDDRITPIWTAPRIDYQNYFHALLVDRSGVLWIGTNGDGIFQVDLNALPIKSYKYQTNFVRDVLVHEMGLNVPNWGKTDRYVYEVRWAGISPYAALGIDTGYELFRANLQTRMVQSLLKLPNTQKNLDIYGGNAVSVANNGLLWLYNPHWGLLKVDSTGRLLERVTGPLSIDRISAIQFLGNKVWLASEESGLYAFDLTTRKIESHLVYKSTDSTSLPSNRVLGLVADPSNNNLLWVGTQNGLGRLDVQKLQFKNWTQERGLPSATIQTLVADQKGDLWFSTVKGISRMSPKTGQLRHFSTSDGLLDVEYRQNHVIKLPDGRIAFGGATGVTVFDPLLMRDSPQSMPTVLTSLKINNHIVEPAQSGSPLTLPLNATETLRLNPWQNFLSLEFAGLQYNKPSTLQYRYQLIGVDADWVYAGNQTEANYTQLAPGTYQFRVTTADAIGRWSPLIKTINIIIDPPWWQTWWAYLIYSLLFIGLVRSYIVFRINRAQLRQKMILKEQEARLIKQNADWQTGFFTNITHEFRTPLTLIINPLEKLLNAPSMPSRTGLRQQLGVIDRNARRLLRLINQLLDISKLEAGQLRIVNVQGNLPEFFSELVKSFQLRAERKGIALTFEAPNVSSDSMFDAQKLETIGYNLIANAIRFTPEGGTIKVKLSLEDNETGAWMYLQVSDSGIGIAPDQLPYIFDRFFQGHQKATSEGTGTGIGLFLVAELTRLLRGTVSVNSTLGEGTNFVVRLPMTESVTQLPETLPIVSWTSKADNASKSDHQVQSTKVQTPLVLVVEDNDELRDFIAGELNGRYRVLTAKDGQEGWQICLTELPELVVSDVMMPLMDGFALLERIKTTPLTAHIAVILLTAKTMIDSRILGLSTGANDYLTKPFNGQELILRIDNLLLHQRQLRQYWQQQMNKLTPSATSQPRADSDDPFLEKLYLVLDRELANSSLNIDQLADELAVSSRTLHRKLSALTGSNANELIRTYRLRKAAGFLQEGCSVTEAAEKAGFESVPYFSRSFKTQFDISPSVYGAIRP